MKSIFYALMLLLFFSYTGKTQQFSILYPNHFDDKPLNGKVISYTDKNFNTHLQPQQKVVDAEYKLTYEITFSIDSADHLTKINRHNHLVKLGEHITELRYSSNRLLSGVYEKNEKQLKPEKKIEFIYDLKKNNLAAIHYESKSRTKKTEYSLNEKQLITQQINYSSTLKLQFKTQFYYNGTKDTCEMTYDDKDNLLYKTVFTYDKNNKLSSVTKYKGTAEMLTRDLFTYDEKGNMTTNTHIYGSKTEKILYTYAFDKFGNWIVRYTSTEGSSEVTKTVRDIQYR